MATRIKCIPFVLLALLLVGAQLSGQEWEKSRQFSAREARQAAAADHDFVYAINNKQVAKYDRESDERIATSQGEAHHLNSGFLWGGNLYCAHSNYPGIPEQSQIKVLDVNTMQLETFKDFGDDYVGSLTWVVRHNDHWWCNFARYKDKKAETFLAKFDMDWNEQARWTYPEQVLEGLGEFSISGGVWRENELLVTGHHEKVLFRLTLPEAGNELAYAGYYRVPFTGQGIAFDPKSGGMVGIIRSWLGQSQIVFASPPRLSQIEKNVKHVENEAPVSGNATQSASPVSVFESPSSGCCDFFDPCCQRGIRRGWFVRCRARVVARRK